jgi:DNA polymerase I-like protein with 3'-5' exonuclease and polymerase domains
MIVQYYKSFLTLQKFTTKNLHMKTYNEIPASMLREVLKYKYDVSLDIETSGLNFTRKKIATLQLWVEGEGFFHDVRDKKPPNFDLFKEVCETRGVNKIIQNAAFEGAYLSWHWDIWLRDIWDTKLMETCILGIENIPFFLLKGLTKEQQEEKYYSKYSSSLKHIVKRRQPLGIKEMSKDLQTAFVDVDDSGVNYYKKINKDDIRYGMTDVQVLPEIKRMQQEDIEAMDLGEVTALENRCVEVVYKMRTFGVLHDTEHWGELANANSKMLAVAINELPADVENWNSVPQVKEYFAEFHGITIDSYDDLPALKGQNEVLDQFIGMRENVHKYATTYGHSWLTTEYTTKAPKEIGPTLGPDNRVHPSFQQIVNTGRFSCSQPNMQQIPSNYDKNPLHIHKKCFIAAPGCKFVEVDFSGQELGLMAAGSQEPGLLEPMLAGDDVHSMQAAKYFPAEWAAAKLKTCTFPQQCDCPGHKPLRAQSKQVTFGMPYGLSASGLSKRIGVTTFTAKKLINTFQRTLPTLNRWIDGNGRNGEKLRFIRTLWPFNRYRNLELEEGWRRRNQGKNTPIQGSGADMLKKAMVLLDEWIEKKCKVVAGKITLAQFKYKIVLVVHDSLVNEVPEKDAEMFAGVLGKCAAQAAETITQIPGLIAAKPEIKDSL